MTSHTLTVNKINLSFGDQQATLDGTLTLTLPEATTSDPKPDPAPKPDPDPKPDPAPKPDPTPKPDSGKVTVKSMSLTTDPKTIHVGDTFKVLGTLHYSDGTTKPVTKHSIGHFDGKLIHQKDGYSWNNTFTALKAGKTSIHDGNSGVTGKATLTILAKK